MRIFLICFQKDELFGNRRNWYKLAIHRVIFKLGCLLTFEGNCILVK